MIRKLVMLVAVAGLFGLAGCRHELKDVWTFRHIEQYFNTFDDDLYELHMDFDYIIVGVENYTDYLNETQ